MGQFIDEQDARRPTEFPRISARYPIPALKATWFAPGRRIGSGSSSVEIRIVDISVAGALIEAPTNKKIKLGTRVKMEISGHDGTAEIRNMRLAERYALSYYGITFLRMSPELEALVHSVVGKVRSEHDLTTVWERRSF